MKNKMLQFVDLKKETPVKRYKLKEKVTLTKFIMSLLLIKQKSNLVDVRSAVSHFVKFIAH